MDSDSEEAGLYGELIEEGYWMESALMVGKIALYWDCESECVQAERCKL